MMGYLLPHSASRVGQVESGADTTPHQVRSYKENLKQESFGARSVFAWSHYSPLETMRKVFKAELAEQSLENV